MTVPTENKRRTSGTRLMRKLKTLRADDKDPYRPLQSRCTRPILHSRMIYTPAQATCELRLNAISSQNATAWIRKISSSFVVVLAYCMQQAACMLCLGRSEVQKNKKEKSLNKKPWKSEENEKHGHGQEKNKRKVTYGRATTGGRGPYWC